MTQVVLCVLGQPWKCGTKTEVINSLCILFYKRQNVHGNLQKICAAYGENAAMEHICQLFTRFHFEWFMLQYAFHFVLQIETNSNIPYISRMYSDILKAFKLKFENYLYQLVKGSHTVGSMFGFYINWMRLTSSNRFSSIICSRTMKKIIHFWREWWQSEIWTIYNNVKCKQWWEKCTEPLQTTPKAGLPTKKVTISIWWYW